MSRKTVNKSRLSRMKASWFGKAVCRLAGEESGQAMLEYVIIATVIAAAVALGAWLFGAQILEMFHSSGSGAVGKHEESRNITETAQGMTTDKQDIGIDHANTYTDDSAAQGAHATP